MTWTFIRARRGTRVAAATVVGCVTAVAVALAQQVDRSSAQALATELRQDTPHRAVLADALGRAEDALERATRLRAAGDEPHARQAEALAADWFRAGRELARASDAEARATDLRRKALDEEAQIAKTRALVEEVIARTGRLRAQIDSIERDGGARRTAVESHDGEGVKPARGSKPTRPASRAELADAGAP